MPHFINKANRRRLLSLVLQTRLYQHPPLSVVRRYRSTLIERLFSITEQANSLPGSLFHEQETKVLPSTSTAASQVSTNAVVDREPDSEVENIPNLLSQNSEEMAPLTVVFGPNGPPALPTIKSDDLRRRVFTHRSVHGRQAHLFEDAENDPSLDYELLELIGDSVLNVVVTSMIKETYPNLRVGPFTKMRTLLVENTTLAKITQAYGLHEEMLVHPAQEIALKKSLLLQADLFEAYIGGIYEEQGIEAVRAWLKPLLKPSMEAAYLQVRKEWRVRPPPDVTVKVSSKNEVINKATKTGTDTVAVGDDTVDPAPQGYLALFNQEINKPDISVEWKWERTKEDKTIWLGKVLVNKKLIGAGNGRSKKVASNEAAKVALREMKVITG